MRLRPAFHDRSTDVTSSDVSLCDVADGFSVRLARFELDEGLRASVTAMGLSEGDVTTVLRRAPFGGPLHVRTSCGAEFAVSRNVASGMRGVLIGAESVAGTVALAPAMGRVLEPSE
ncbi:MAG: FeoA family protein [Polyangiaceae bacterium]